MGSGHVGLGRCSQRDGRVVAHWLTERDHPWLRDLIEEYRAFVGEPRGRLDAHLAADEGDRRSRGGRPVALAVLDTLFRTEVAAEVQPQRARSAVFRAAAGRSDRGRVLSDVARALGVSSAGLEQSLLADVPEERRLTAPDESAAPTRIALLCNLAIAQAALRISSEIKVALLGNARCVVRHAKLHGLICTVAPSAPVELRISGPLALFKHTSLYGRHLAELVPLLAWSRSFGLEAKCLFRGRPGVFALDPDDPLPPSPPPRLYDSELERRFARDFTRVARDWELVREPEPLATEDTLIFPDFALRHRHDRSRRWLLEIVGYWTAGYIEEKLRRLRAARPERLVLCIDAARDCGRDALPPRCPVVRYRKRIDVREVLRIIEGA